MKFFARPAEQFGHNTEETRNLNLQELIASWQLKYPHGASLLPQLARVDDIIPGINTDGLISIELFAQSKDPALLRSRLEGQYLGCPWDTPFAINAFAYLYTSRTFYQTHYRHFLRIKAGFASIPVIDLGAGSCNVGYKIANLLDGHGYVGVEPYHYDELVSSIVEGDITDDAQQTQRWKKYSRTLRSCNRRRIPFNVVAEDALGFLRRTPDRSVGIFSFGTDNLIINNTDYIESVKAEINRVLHPNSLMICENTVFIPQSSLQHRRDLLTTEHSGVAIFGR
jgi:hypothetical protein